MPDGPIDHFPDSHSEVESRTDKEQTPVCNLCYFWSNFIPAWTYFLMKSTWDPCDEETAKALVETDYQV